MGKRILFEGYCVVQNLDLHSLFIAVDYAKIISVHFERKRPLWLYWYICWPLYNSERNLAECGVSLRRLHTT